MTASAGGKGRLASVIIPCRNQLAFTSLCIPALFRHTRSPWELIAIDNGSTDGTVHYLPGGRDAAPVLVEVITNPTTVTCPPPATGGLRPHRACTKSY